MAKRKNKSSSILKSLVLIALIGAAGYYLWRQYTINTSHGFKHELLANKPENFNSYGLDISHHQGEIDWDKIFIQNELDSIIDFVYFKVSEGIDHADTKWEENRAQLKKHAKKSGAYHFFLPKKDALLQANNFIKHYSYQAGDLPPVIDVELEGISNDDLIAKMLIWMNVVQKATGQRPIIYTSLHFYETKFNTFFKNETFWIASYSRMPDLENNSNIAIWQYSEKGRFEGINEYVDLNVGVSNFELRR